MSKFVKISESEINIIKEIFDNKSLYITKYKSRQGRISPFLITTPKQNIYIYKTDDDYFQISYHTGTSIEDKICDQIYELTEFLITLENKIHKQFLFIDNPRKFSFISKNSYV